MAYINDFLLQSIYLLPEPTNYAAGVVSDAYREAFGAEFPTNRKYPNQSEEAYKAFWLQNTPLTEQQQKVMQRIQQQPLPAHFKTIQERYDIGSLRTPPIGASDQQKMVHSMLVRGEQRFRGAQTVGDLQKILADDAVRSMIFLERDRFGGDDQTFGRQLGAMTQSLFERVFPNYQPAEGDYQTSSKLRSFMNFAVSGMFSGLKTEQREAEKIALDLNPLERVTTLQPFTGLREEGGAQSDPRTPYLGIKQMTPDEQLLEMRRQVFQRYDFNVPTGFYIDPTGKMTSSAGRHLRSGPHLWAGQSAPSARDANTPIYMSAREAMFLTGNVSESEVKAYPEYRRFLPSNAPTGPRGEMDWSQDIYATRRIAAHQVSQNILRELNRMMGVTGDPSMSGPSPIERWQDQNYNKPNEAMIAYERQLSQDWYRAQQRPGSKNIQLELPFGSTYRTTQRVVTFPQESNVILPTGAVVPRNPPGQAAFRTQITGESLQEPFQMTGGRAYFADEQLIRQRAEQTWEQLSYFDPATAAMTSTTGLGVPYRDRIRRDDRFSIANRVYSYGQNIVHRTASRLAQATAPQSLHDYSDVFMPGEPGMEEMTTQRPGHFQARQLMPRSTMPPGMLPYEQAFEGSGGRGRAINNIGYLRAIDPSGKPFVYMDEIEFAKNFQGIEQFQKSYLVRKMAGFHEIGHVVLKYAPPEVATEFAKLYKTRLDQVGKDNMMVREWPDEKANYREEFAQAYAAASTMGGEALAEHFPEYSEFFANYQEQIEQGEQAATLVEHFGVPSAFMPVVSEKQVLGELPRSLDNPFYQKYKPYGYLKEYLDFLGTGQSRRKNYLEMVSQLRAAAETGQPLQARVAVANAGGERAAWQEAGLIAGYDVRNWQRGSDPNTWSAEVSRSPESRAIRHARHIEDIKFANETVSRQNTDIRTEADLAKRRASGELIAREQSEAQRAAAYRAQPGARDPNNMLRRIQSEALDNPPTRIATERGAVNEYGAFTSGNIELLNPQQTQEAMGVGINAALNAASTTAKGSIAETFASVLQRFNKSILDTYQRALTNPNISVSERQILDTQRDVSVAVGKSILNRAGRALDPAEAASARAMSQGFRVRIGPGNVREFLAQDPDLAARMQQEGMDAGAMARSAQGYIVDSSRGPVLFGGQGAPGGPQGPMGQGPSGRPNIFGGRAGALMYSAYILRRMWNMTAAPEIQGANQYGQYLSEFAPTQAMAMAREYGPGQMSLAQTDAGFAMRQATVERYRQRGAYQMWGGITDVQYGMMGNDAAARMTSLAGVALGIGAAGAIAGPTLGMIAGIAGEGAAGAGLLSTVGTGLATAAPWIAGGVMVGGLALEAYNAWFNPNPEQPLTPGGIVRNAGNWWNYTKANQQALIEAGFNADSMGLPGSVPQMDREKVLAQMNPRQRAMYEYQGEPEQTRLMRQELEAVNAVTGEDIGAMQPAFRAIVRGIGRVPTGMADISNRWQEMGLSFAEATQGLVNAAGQFGFEQGTRGYEQFWNQFQGVDNITQYQRLMSAAQRNAQFAGQISPFFANSRTAEQLTAAGGLTTAQRMGPVQAMFSAAAQGGADLDQIISYSTGAGAWTERPTPVSLGAAMTAQTLARGTFTSMNVDIPLMSTLMGMGQPAEQAMGAGIRLGFQNQQQVQNAGRWLDMARQYNYGYENPEQVISQIPGISGYAASVIPSIAEPLMRAGYGNAMEVLAQGMGQNLSNEQISLVGAGMGGDLGAMSWMANTQPQLLQNPDMYRFYNQAGRPIYTTNYGQFTRLVQSRVGDLFSAGLVPQGSLISQPLQNLANLPAGASGFERTQALLGGTGIDTEMMQAFSISSQSAARLHQTRMAGFQRQQAGIAMAGVGLARRFLWGGGDWQNPTEDSIWGIQDRQRALAHRQQMYEFGYTRQMMDTQNQFAIRQEAISGERMEVGQAYQRWQFGFQQQGMNLQRGWARQDWQFQDMMRNQGFGWAMEDMDEAIRTSTGRQRSRLVRQKERMTTQFNQEGEQLDTKRERQEELWAREDERFEKSQDYSERLMELDEKQFDLQQEQRETLYQMQTDHLDKQMEFYKENKKLQDEMIAKQREYQVEQLNLQAAAAGVQAQMAEEQITYNEAVQTTEEVFSLTEDHAKQISKYDPTKIFGAFSDMVIDMDKLSVTKIQTMGKMYNEMDAVDFAQLRAWERLFSVAGSIDPNKLTAIANALLEIEAGGQ